MRLLFTCLAAVAAVIPALAQQNVVVEFGTDTHDIEIDAPRARAYVSLPLQNRVAIVDTNNWSEVGEFTVAPRPQGLALSLDGTRLFVAKNGAGAVAVIDIASGSQSDILLGTLLDNSLTYDVIEAQPNRLFVSANPSSGGFAYIVQVDLASGNAASRVASNRIIRCAPTFAVNPAQTALYVGECFSPNSLYKLDLTQPNAPIIAEDNHGSVSGTSFIAVTPDGGRLVVGSGQILDANTITPVGQIGGGIPRFDLDPTRVFVAAAPSALQTWNMTSQTQIEARTFPCTFSTFNGLRQFVVLEGESGFIALDRTRICGIADVPTCTAAVSQACTSLPNSTGAVADLVGTGEPRFSQNAFWLELSGAPANTYALLVFGAEPAQLPLGNGWLCISPFGGISRLGAPARVDASGAWSQHLNFLAPPLLNGPITAYSTWIFQAWYRDAAAPLQTGLNTSNAVRVTFCP